MFGNIIQNTLLFALGINTEGHSGKIHFPAAILQNIIFSKYAQSNAEGI